jgi:hypothetical protein
MVGTNYNTLFNQFQHDQANQKPIDMSSISHQQNLLLANQIQIQATEKQEQLNQEISENPNQN